MRFHGSELREGWGGMRDGAVMYQIAVEHAVLGIGEVKCSAMGI